MYTQTPDYYNDYIAHYGVKGMKWRHRKAGLRLIAKHLKNRAVKGYVEGKYKLKKAYRNSGISQRLAGLGLIGKHSKNKAVKGYVETKYKTKKAARNAASSAKSYASKAHATYDTRYGKSASKGDSRYRNTGNLSSRGYSGSRDSGVSTRVSNTGTRKSVNSNGFNLSAQRRKRRNASR